MPRCQLSSYAFQTMLGRRVPRLAAPTGCCAAGGELRSTTRGESRRRSRTQAGHGDARSSGGSHGPLPWRASSRRTSDARSFRGRSTSDALRRKLSLVPLDAALRDPSAEREALGSDEGLWDAEVAVCSPRTRVRQLSRVASRLQRDPRPSRACPVPNAARRQAVLSVLWWRRLAIQVPSVKPSVVMMSRWDAKMALGFTVGTSGSYPASQLSSNGSQTIPILSSSPIRSAERSPRCARCGG